VLLFRVFIGDGKRFAAACDGMTASVAFSAFERQHWESISVDMTK
jgi:hypothetical protein